MATLVRLKELSEAMAEDIFHRNNEVEIYRELEYSAAVKIQSWFRGARVRAYLKYLDINAIEIQRKWRGFLGRKKYRIKVKEQVCRMKLNYYNHIAAKIQKVWKGYFVRKYIFNYYSRKKYLKALEVKNELVRQELEDHAEQQEQERLWKEEALTKKKRDYQARKNHYLLSTEVKPGIYNSPFQPYPSEMEFHLRNARPLSRQKEKKICDQKARAETLPPLQARPQVRSHIFFRICLFVCVPESFAITCASYKLTYSKIIKVGKKQHTKQPICRLIF